MKSSTLVKTQTRFKKNIGSIYLPDRKEFGKAIPPDYRREIILADGTRLLVRPITCKDKKAFMRFHSQLSAQTRFLRYHYLKCEITEEDLKHFCDLDYVNSMALVVTNTREKNADIIALGQFIRVPPDHTAEIALVVEDSMQGKGIGTQLLRHLAILARQQGIHHFVGEVLRNNGKMLSVFNKCDPGLEYEVDSPSTCNINTSVDQIINGY